MFSTLNIDGKKREKGGEERGKREGKGKEKGRKHDLLFCPVRELDCTESTAITHGRKPREIDFLHPNHGELCAKCIR